MAVLEHPRNPNPNPNPNPIIVREVWGYNLKQEFELISSVIDKYPYVTMDTEYPGVYYKPTGEHRAIPFELVPTEKKYELLKLNVDAMKLIQLGITLSDDSGNLPDLGFSGHRYIWQFNFSDFDLEKDLKMDESIKLLVRHGIDFKKNRVHGVNSVDFGELMMSSGLVLNDEVKWITFQGSYDVGYLLKILTGKKLPAELSEFLKLNRVFLGDETYDVKHLMKFLMRGGLDRAALSLGLNRAVGQKHQAGSDSLLTWQVFRDIRNIYFNNKDPKDYAGVLHGFESL